jgi:hypothetical protein
MSDFDNIPIEYYEEETEMLQMWLEKLNRPGRVIARNCNEISEWELKYNLVNDDDVENKRNVALEWIQNMESDEFQDRLLNETLPEFERILIEPDKVNTLERDTCHPYCLMREIDHNYGNYNQGYLKRVNLKFMGVDKFMRSYYEEFKPYPSLEKFLSEVEEANI